MNDFLRLKAPAVAGTEGKGALVRAITAGRAPGRRQAYKSQHLPKAPPTRTAGFTPLVRETTTSNKLGKCARTHFTSIV